MELKEWQRLKKMSESIKQMIYALTRPDLPMVFGADDKKEDVMFDVEKLVCYGCSHSAAMQEYPSGPSGERPCCFCVRNKDRKLEVTCWYDGSKAVKIPMDCYHSLDMKDQIDLWFDKIRKENGNEN